MKWLLVTNFISIKTHLELRPHDEFQSLTKLYHKKLLSWKSNRMIYGLHRTAVLLEAYIEMG